MSAETYTPAGLVIGQTVEPTVLVGEEVPELLPGRTLDRLAREVHEGLLPYRDIMGQMHPDQVREEMDAGNFVLVINPDPKPVKLLATARDTGRLKDPESLEIPLEEETRVVGTWLNLNGAKAGRQALNAGADLAASRPGVNAVVALVGQRNTAGIRAMERAGGVAVGTRISEKVPGQSPVIVYQLRGKKL